MELDENVCLCKKVPLRKVVSHLTHHRPKVASQLSECFGAGTGCGWCVPTLESLHRKFVSGEPLLCDSPAEAYAQGREEYKVKKRADAAAAAQAPSPLPPRIDSETESQ